MRFDPRRNLAVPGAPNGGVTAAGEAWFGAPAGVVDA